MLDLLTGWACGDVCTNVPGHSWPVKRICYMGIRSLKSSMGSTYDRIMGLIHYVQSHRFRNT